MLGFFFLIQKRWRRRLQDSEETLKRTLDSLSFWRTLWTLPTTVLPHTQSAKRLDVPHCAVSHSHICHQLDYCWKEGCHPVQRQESKNHLNNWHRLSGFISQKALRFCTYDTPGCAWSLFKHTGEVDLEHRPAPTAIRAVGRCSFFQERMNLLNWGETSDTFTLAAIPSFSLKTRWLLPGPKKKIHYKTFSLRPFGPPFLVLTD